MDTFLNAKHETGQADDPGAGVCLEDGRRAFYRAHSGDTTEAKKKAFQRARDALVEAGYLAVTNDIYRLARFNECKP